MIFGYKIDGDSAGEATGHGTGEEIQRSHPTMPCLIDTGSKVTALKLVPERIHDIIRPAVDLLS